MHPLLKKLEHFTDRIIPYLLILLAIVLGIEFFFKDIAEKYYSLIFSVDITIIVFFSLDLIFKFNRVRKIKLFLKKYWLDIIAVFPFFLLFRVVEEVFAIFRISTELGEGQKFFHIGLETEKLATGIIYQVSKSTYDENLPQLKKEPLIGKSLKVEIKNLLEEFY